MTHSFPTRRPSELVECDRVRTLGPTRRRRIRVEQRALAVGRRARKKRHACRLRIRVRRPFAAGLQRQQAGGKRSEEHTSELQSLMRISYAVFCLKKKTTNTNDTTCSN